MNFNSIKFLLFIFLAQLSLIPSLHAMQDTVEQKKLNSAKEQMWKQCWKAEGFARMALDNMRKKTIDGTLVALLSIPQFYCCDYQCEKYRTIVKTLEEKKQ